MVGGYLVVFVVVVVAAAAAAAVEVVVVVVDYHGDKLFQAFLIEGVTRPVLKSCSGR